MVIDGVLASEAVDSSGEVLDVRGADVSDWEKGTMMLNYEHRGDDAQGASGNDVVGKVVYAKKLYERSDCENDRQREFWDKVKLPFIYGICRLFDGAGHPGATSLAAIIRDNHANDEPLVVRYSVEGSTLERDGVHLKRTLIKRTALTLKPCNRSAISGLLEDPNAPPGFEKRPDKEAETQVKDILAELPAAKKAERPFDPACRPLSYYEATYSPLLKDEDPAYRHLLALQVVKRALESGLLAKASTAGSSSGAPSTLTGGAALQREDISERAKALNLARAALRDYGKSVTDKSEFRTFLKHRLPDASEDFLDHFADKVHEFTVRKAEQDAKVTSVLMKVAQLTVDLRKAAREAKEKPVEFAGHQVLPGRARHAGGEYSLLLEGPERYHAVPSDKAGGWEADDLVTLPRRLEGTHFLVTARPRVLVNGAPHTYHHEG